MAVVAVGRGSSQYTVAAKAEIESKGGVIWRRKQVVFWVDDSRMVAWGWLSYDKKLVWWLAGDDDIKSSDVFLLSDQQKSNKTPISWIAKLYPIATMKRKNEMGTLGMVIARSWEGLSGRSGRVVWLAMGGVHEWSC